MLSDFQRAKLERRFELLDMDGDGYITADDYDEAAANVCRAFDFDQDSPQYEKIHVIYLRLWMALSRGMEDQESGRISRGQFIGSCARLFVEDEGGFDRFISPIALAVFDVVAPEGRGTVDVGQVATWFNAYGVCVDDAERAFRAVDRNGDGLLSAQEVQQALREFYTGDDPHAPGNLIFGPLPIAAAAMDGGRGNWAAKGNGAPKSHGSFKANGGKSSAKGDAARPNGERDAVSMKDAVPMKDAVSLKPGSAKRSPVAGGGRKGADRKGADRKGADRKGADRKGADRKGAAAGSANQ